MPASETVTVALEGPDISLDSFVETVTALRALLKDLSAEVAPGSQLAWDVEDLQRGSAITTVRGRAISGDPDDVGRVSRAYEAIGDALDRRSPIPYSEVIRRRVTALTAVLNDHVPALRLETANRDFTILKEGLQPVRQPRQAVTLGAVEGRIETLSKHRSLRFTLYDTLDNRAVACYLNPGEEDRVHMLWGHRAIVEGNVYRDPLSGRPTTIREITAVVPVPESDPDEWRTAEGALADIWDGESAGEAIRRIRDAW